MENVEIGTNNWFEQEKNTFNERDGCFLDNSIYFKVGQETDSLKASEIIFAL